MMKNYMKIIILALMIFLLPVRLMLAQEPAAALDFELQDTDQDIITLSSYKDKQSVVLLFWVTWSPLCQSELRALNSTYARLVKDDIEVLCINSGELPDTVDNFIRSYNLAYRVLLDKDASVTADFEIIGFPTYVLIDKKGDIVFKDNYFPYAEYKDLIFKGEQ